MIDDPDRRDDVPADKSPTFGSAVGATAAGDQHDHTAPGEAIEDVIGAPHPTEGDASAATATFAAVGPTGPTGPSEPDTATKVQEKAGDAAQVAADKAQEAADKASDAAHTAAHKVQDVAHSVQSGEAARTAAAVPDKRPEVLVGAAFAGGIALAFVLRRLAS